LPASQEDAAVNEISDLSDTLVRMGEALECIYDGQDIATETKANTGSMLPN
jgi:hypothetical protein